MAKKFLMTLVWRISQTGPLLSIFFWSAALAGIFWPIVGRSETHVGPLWEFITRTLGISADRATLVGLLLLFFLFASIIMLIGFLYDRRFKLWREQMEIAVERNPFAEDQLYRKEQLQWEQFWLPLARAVYRISEDPALKDAIAAAEEWVRTGKIRSK